MFNILSAIKNLQEDDGTADSLSSLPQASFNYINSIVGSGVIGIPYALHRAGFGLGLLLLVLVAIITDYSLILMVSDFSPGNFYFINVNPLKWTRHYFAVGTEAVSIWFSLLLKPSRLY